MNDSQVAPMLNDSRRPPILNGERAQKVLAYQSVQADQNANLPYFQAMQTNEILQVETTNLKALQDSRVEIQRRYIQLVGKQHSLMDELTLTRHDINQSSSELTTVDRRIRDIEARISQYQMTGIQAEQYGFDRRQKELLSANNNEIRAMSNADKIAVPIAGKGESTRNTRSNTRSRR